MLIRDSVWWAGGLVCMFLKSLMGNIHMICISVTPKSRKFAKVDLLNASGQCDLVELCMDHFLKKPDITDLISVVKNPILISCRRKQDGGQWAGTEEDRLQLLRQAIGSGPEYVELELDIAEKIPRFGETKRVISFTSAEASIRNVDEIYEQACAVGADVVKFAGPMRTLDASWPLLVALTGNRTPPIVGTGLGRAGLMLSLLGRMFGSPWIYAALEKGMEAYPEQATISELDEVYHWRGIDAKSRFIGICGFGQPEIQSIQVLNAAFDALQLNRRCLPLAWGRPEKLPRMLDQLKILSLLVSPSLSAQVSELDAQADDAVVDTSFCDLLLRRKERWRASNRLSTSVLKATEETIARKTPARADDERPLDRKNVLIIGSNEAARAVIFGFQRRRCVLSVTDPDDASALCIAKSCEIRHVPFSAIYDTLADVIVLTDPAIPIGHRKTELSPSVLQPPMTVADVSSLPDTTEFLREARERGCEVVNSRAIFVDRLRAQFPAFAGAELPQGVIEQVLGAK